MVPMIMGPMQLNYTSDTCATAMWTMIRRKQNLEHIRAFRFFYSCNPRTPFLPPCWVWLSYTQFVRLVSICVCICLCVFVFAPKEPMRSRCNLTGFLYSRESMREVRGGFHPPTFDLSFQSLRNLYFSKIFWKTLSKLRNCPIWYWY